MKRAAALLLLLASLGCNHVTTKVPGTLDMRTDGAEAQTKSDSVPGARSGMDSFFGGNGITSSGAQVKIEERRWWVVNLINWGDQSATEEIRTVMGDGALRNVSVGDEYQFMDCASGFVVSLIPCVGGLFDAPRPAPHTATFQGTRIAIGSANPPVEAPVEAAPPTDDAAPVGGVQ